MATATWYNQTSGGFLFLNAENAVSASAPRVESFIVRFVQNCGGPSRQAMPPDWRGVIVHIQTNESKGFSDFADAVAFMARYVHVGDIVFEQSQEPEST